MKIKIVLLTTLLLCAVVAAEAKPRKRHRIGRTAIALSAADVALAAVDDGDPFTVSVPSDTTPTGDPLQSRAYAITLPGVYTLSTTAGSWQVLATGTAGTRWLTPYNTVQVFLTPPATILVVPQ